MTRRRRRAYSYPSMWPIWFMVFMMIALALVVSNKDEEVSSTESLVVEEPFASVIHQKEVKTSTLSDPVFIDRFYSLVAEYNRTVNEELVAWDNDTENRGRLIEQKHMVCYHTFCCLRYYYLEYLSVDDKSWLFANLRSDHNLPQSIFYDYPGPIATARLGNIQGDVRKDFELFVYQSIWEIDYQCEFDIIYDEVALAEVRQEVRSTMDAIGVPYPKTLQ